MKTKEQIDKEFETNQKTIDAMVVRQHQLQGQWQLLDEEEKIQSKKNEENNSPDDADKVLKPEKNEQTK